MIPGLTARPFWNNDSIPWIRELESKFVDIKAEFLRLRDQEHMFQVIVCIRTTAVYKKVIDWVPL